MYHTGLNPHTMQPIYVPKTPHEKALQRALIQYRNPANWELVREALLKAHRPDLIGWGEKCLIRPKRPKAEGGKAARRRAAGPAVAGNRRRGIRRGPTPAPAVARAGALPRPMATRAASVRGAFVATL